VRWCVEILIDQTKNIVRLHTQWLMEEIYQTRKLDENACENLDRKLKAVDKKIILK